MAAVIRLVTVVDIDDSADAAEACDAPVVEDPARLVSNRGGSDQVWTMLPSRLACGSFR